MSSNKSREEPAMLMIQSWSKNDYASVLQHLNELESTLGTSHKRIQNNKEVAQFMLGDMKGIEKFRNSLCQIIGVNYPEIDMPDNTSSFAIYNYAVLLYHSRHFNQCFVLLEKLLTSVKHIKDKNLAQYIILLLMEVTLCRQLPKKTLNVAKNHGESVKANNKLLSAYERLVCRAQLMLNQKITTNLKADCIENLFVLAEQKHFNGELNDAINLIAQYKSLKLNYDLKSQGEDIWAALNNNLGVCYLSMYKSFLATKYLQNAVKEHFRAMESDDSKRLIACRDRPFYVHNLGVALLAANKPDGAFECLVEAIRHYPSNPRIWLRLAECCVRKYSNDEAQQFTVKKIGKNPHSRLLLEKKCKDRYSNSGESFAIPSLSLEFAALCLRNAISLISNHQVPSDTSAHVIQAPPGILLNWKQWCQLKNSVLVLQTYIFLQLQDPFAALLTAKDILAQVDVSNEHKALAHIYAAEALISLDKITEAVEHLHPPMINEIASALPPQMRDKICVSVWAKAVECHIIRGDLVTARKILSQINSPSVLPLQIYLEMSTGNIDKCHAILRKHRYTSSVF